MVAPNDLGLSSAAPTWMYACVGTKATLMQMEI